MVNWIEIGLFLYALAGSATMGYWFLVSFSPSFRERDKNTKLGYSVIAGMIYTGAIFFVSILLVSGHYNNLNFLETFFWMIPISFVLLALTASGKRAWILIERAQYGEQAPQKEPEEKLGTSLLTAQTPGTQRIPPMETGTAKSAPFISETSQPIEREKEPEEKTEEEFPEEEQEPLEEPGETEKDVVEEIRKIMKGEMTEKEKKQEEMKRTLAGDLEEKEEIRKIMGTPASESEEEFPFALSPSMPAGGMEASDLEKIKEDLKKKIKANETSEKIKEGLKKKETRKR